MSMKLVMRAPLVITLAVLVAYAIAPWGGLVWDDQLVAKQQMAAIRTLADVLAPPGDIPQWTYAYYRPVVLFSYVVDQALFGRGAAAGPHVLNVAYHLLATLFTWLLARRLLDLLPCGPAGALVAGLLFAVHPIHTESVSWITGRSDTLATMLLLPSLLLILRWRDVGSVLALCAAAVLFLLALMAKEVALAGLLIAPLLMLFVPRPTPHQPAPSGLGPVVTWVAAAVAGLGAAAVYWWLRAAAGSVASPLQPGTPLDLAAKALRAAGYYLAKLVWPWPQSHFVSWDLVPDVPVAAGVIVMALAAAAGSLRLLRGDYRGVALTGLAWIACALAPSLAVALTGVAATPVAERYLYLPSVGLSLWVGALFCRAYAGRSAQRVAWAAAAVLAVGLGATMARGTVWLSDLRLWTDAAEKGASHAVALIEFGKAQYLAEQFDAAEATFRRAGTQAGTPRLRAIASYNLGNISLHRRDVAEAGRRFAAAVAADPSYPLGHYGLGRVLFEQGADRVRRGRIGEAIGLIEEAESQLRESLRLNPAHANSHVQLARALAGRGELLRASGQLGAARESLDAAVGHLDTALRLEPLLRTEPELQRLSGQLAVGLQGLPR
jgi:tetratricopeptide (TPR) repeat protein